MRTKYKIYFVNGNLSIEPDYIGDKNQTRSIKNRAKQLHNQILKGILKMKLSEVLNESKMQEHMREMIEGELESIGDNPSDYFKNLDIDAAERLSKRLVGLTDSQWDELVTHKLIMDSIQDNYQSASDTGPTSSLDFASVIDALRDITGD